MDWPSTRAEFQARFDALNIQYTPSLVSDLNAALQAYSTAEGDARNAAYQTVMAKMAVVNQLKQSYQALNESIIQLFKNESANQNLTTILNDNGTLQKKIHQLRKVEKEIRVDVESAVARDELLRSRETNSHQLFLMDRPVRKGMIPYLWVLSIFFIGIALLIIRSMSPSLSGAYGATDAWYAMITQTLLSTQVLLGLLGACIITIIGLALKVGGVFGK